MRLTLRRQDAPPMISTIEIHGCNLLNQILHQSVASTMVARCIASADPGLWEPAQHFSITSNLHVARVCNPCVLVRQDVGRYFGQISKERSEKALQKNECRGVPRPWVENPCHENAVQEKL
jgi:hypothetical protein